MIPLSVVIPYKHSEVRIGLLHKQSLCIREQGIGAEVILVEQTPLDSGWYSDVVKNLSNLCVTKHIQLRTERTEFNKSWCMNVGARNASYNYVVFMDADMTFPNDFFKKISDFIESYDHKIFMCWGQLIAEAGKDNPRERRIRPDMTCALGGIWCAKKQFYFEEFGGMNETFWGYGGEDNEAYERACKLLNIEVPHLAFMNYEVRHQYHDWVKPDINATPLFEKGKRNPAIITERIKAAGVGKPDTTSPIETSDLK